MPLFKWLSIFIAMSCRDFSRQRQRVLTDCLISMCRTSLSKSIIDKLLAKSEKQAPCLQDLASKQGGIQSLVAHTGFEPVISSLRGRCPRPLDECASYLECRASHRHNDNYYTTEIQQAIQGSNSFTRIYRDNSCAFIVEIACALLQLELLFEVSMLHISGFCLCP